MQRKDNGAAGITAIVNTRNASATLAGTLESLVGFDELLVCDMESEDDTPAIARRYGARVITFPKAGCTCVEPARDYALRRAACEWVLFVDADEVVPAGLPEYLRHYVSEASEREGVGGLHVARINRLAGTADRGTYPDYQLRFMRRDKAEWPSEIHSRPVISGSVGYIPSRRRDLALIHKDPGLHAALERHNRYSDNHASDMLAAGKRVTLWGLIVKPWWRFFKAYVLRGGFLNGRRGYICAKMGAAYKFDVLAKVVEREG